MKSKLPYAVPALLAVAFISHLQWFNPYSILTHSDWSYWPQQALKELWYSWGTWVDFQGIGAPNVQIPFIVFNIIWAALANLGFNYDVATKITFFIPVAILGFVSPYLLSKNLTSNKLISLISALFYGTVSYFLVRQTAHLTIALVYALTPLIILSFKKALETNKAYQWVLFVLLYSIGIGYEVRIMLIVSIVLSFYFLIFYLSQIKKNITSIAISMIILLGLNVYWILPTLLGGLTSNIAQIAQRGLFGNFLFDLSHALASADSSWTGSLPNQDFTLQPILLSFWFFPILAFSAFLFRDRLSKKENTAVIFFAVVSLVGVFLTKQSDVPLTSAYQWLYDHLPTFSLFRESSKFYLLTAIGYAGLISFSLVAMSRATQNTKLKYAYLATIVLAAALSLYNLKPLFTGEMETTFTSKQVPSDYTTLENFLKSQPDFFRTYWVPTSPRWAYYDNTHPEISGVQIYQSDLKNLVGQNIDKLPTNQQIMNILQTPYAKEIFDNSQVKYVIVPLRDEANNDDFFIYYGDDRQFYIDALNKTSFLKRVDLGTKELAVYQNTNYVPYIHSLATIYKIPTTDTLGETYNFTHSQLQERSFNFNLGSGTHQYPATSIVDPFLTLQESDFSNGKIIKNLNLPTQENSQLYFNTNQPTLSYQTGKDSVTFFSTNKNEVSIDSRLVFNKPEDRKTVATLKTAHSKTYYLGLGDSLQSLSTTPGTTKILGAINETPQVFSTNGPNLIPNPSFEDNLQQQKLQDCNHYDERDLISMKIDDQASTDGQSSLQLDADQHTACTGPNPITVKGGASYLLSFDYQIKGGRQVGYEMDFDDPSKTTIKKTIVVPDNSWRSYLRNVQIPSGATHLTLLVYGYPDDRRKTHSITHYDNFTLYNLNPETPINVNYNKSFSKTDLNGSENSLTFSDPSYTFSNLIPNPSFEKGLWQKTAGDCNSFDDKPALGMRLTQESKSNGNYSLQLEAKRHDACTGPDPIEVKENTDYRFSFDYQSPNAAQAEYYLSFDDPNQTVDSNALTIKDSDWHTFSKTIKTPSGASHMSLLVYSIEKDLGNTYVVTRYDNFNLTEIPDITGRYFLVSAPTQPLTPPASITYDSANPTLKYVHVTGAKTPFYVAMSEAYHNGWRLELNNSQVNGRLRGWIPWVHPNAVADAQHVKLNDFENGWYVDPSQLCQDNPSGCVKNSDGSYDLQMQIEFVPQRWFYLGTLISVITLAGCLLYLIIYALTRLFRRPRKPKTPTKEAPPSSLSTYWTQLHSTKQ